MTPPGDGLLYQEGSHYLRSLASLEKLGYPNLREQVTAAVQGASADRRKLLWQKESKNGARWRGYRLAFECMDRHGNEVHFEVLYNEWNSIRQVNRLKRGTFELKEFEEFRLFYGGTSC